MRTYRMLSTAVVIITVIATSYAQTYDIRFELDRSSCLPNDMCYFIQLRSSNDSSWHLGAQNYRIFYDGGTASFVENSAVSMLPIDRYSSALLQISVDNVNATSLSTNLPFASNLSFINYSIDLINLAEGGILLPGNGQWVTTSRICFQANEETVQDTAICLRKVWARESITEPYAAAYVVVSSWESSFRTSPAKSRAFFDSGDGDGCVTTQNIIVHTQDLSCFEDEFGSVEFELDPARNPYRITLPGATSFSRIRPGAYKAMIQDGTGCEYTRSFEIKRPDALDVQVIHVAHPRSSDSSDGSIDIAVKGGTAPYFFKWIHNENLISTQQNLRQVPAGDYHLKVKDINQCERDAGMVSIDAVTATNDPEIVRNASIYPNPVEDLLIVEFSDQALQIEQIALWNLEGKNIYLKNYRPQQKINVDMNGFQVGLYVMRVVLTNREIITTTVYKK